MSNIGLAFFLVGAVLAVAWDQRAGWIVIGVWAALKLLNVL